MRKIIYLLNIGDYAPELTGITYPYIFKYATKIDATVHIISERKFPDWDLDYEKLQIYELSKQYEADWNIYIDSDALLHPDMPDLTELLPFNTVAHHGQDFAPFRWTYDKYFRRDGRHIGSCNWFAMASSWCTDLWRPLDDMTMKEAVENIQPTNDELKSGVITAEHLVSDYALSRNIARFGLKFKPLLQLFGELGFKGSFFHHEYTVPVATKIANIKETIVKWRIH